MDSFLNSSCTQAKICLEFSRVVKILNFSVNLQDVSK